MATTNVLRFLNRSCFKSFTTLAVCKTVPLVGIICSNYITNPTKNNLLLQNVRFKYANKGKGKTQDDDETDTDDDDEFTNERDSKIVKTKMNSLRADLILKIGLNLARNKIETHFYESKIRLNGKKLMKKSEQLSVGDEIDIIRGPSPHNKEHLLISRVEILSATPKDENLAVVLRRYKTLIIENYKDAWSSSD